MIERGDARHPREELEHAARLEMERQRRQVDQVLSMHSALRDWNRAVGTTLICVVLIASVLGVAFAFAGGSQEVVIFGVAAQRATWLGWLAVVTFAISLVELVLDPRGASRRRDQAVRSLAALKGEYRATVPEGQEVQESARLSERYEAVMRTLPPIPEPLFNRLKAAHLRKREISKILSARPGLSRRQASKILEKSLADNASDVRAS